MAGYSIIRDDRDKGAREIRITSLAVTIGDLLERLTGAVNWTATSASSEAHTRKAIAMETVASGATTVLAIELDGSELVRVPGTGTAAVTDDGDQMAASTVAIVANTHTNVSADSHVVFVQEGIGPAATDLIGHVLVGNGINPDLT